MSALLVAAISVASRAAAQCEPEPEPPDSVRSVARAHYTDGVRASQQQDWEGAREAFQRGYDVAPFAPIVYNLATAQAETGRLVAAAENYRRFLRRCSTAESPDTRADATELLGQLEPRIARARVEVAGLGASDVVELDDVALNRAMLSAPIPVDPGAHVLRVLRRGEEVGLTPFRVAEGGHESVALTVPEDEGAPREDTGSGDGGIDGGVLAAVLVVVGLAVAAGVLIPALVLTSGSTQEPLMGTWAPVRLPLVRF
ncbi:MAG: tetratricopeptide repeat protein [Sandaracinaceae bacterium]